MNWMTKSCNPQVTVVGERCFFFLPDATVEEQVLSLYLVSCMTRRWLYRCTVLRQSSECKYLMLIWKGGFVEVGSEGVVLVVAVRFFSSYTMRYLLVRSKIICVVKWEVCFGIGHSKYGQRTCTWVFYMNHYLFPLKKEMKSIKIILLHQISILQQDPKLTKFPLLADLLFISNT